MRKLILWIVFCIPLIALAQPKPQDKIEVTHLCYDTDKLFKALSLEYKEVPVFMGEADDIAESVMSLWVSKKGLTWTIVASKDKTSCVVGSGKNLQLVNNGKPI